MGLAEQIKPGDWRSVRSAIAKLNTKLGPTSKPTFAGQTIINNISTADISNISAVCTVAAGLNVLRVTGLQTDDVAMSGTLRGAYIDVSNGGLAATGTIRGMELKARTEAPGDTGSDVAVLEGLSISADSKGHSVTTMRAAEFILDGSGGGTIDEAVGLRIANNLQANKADYIYGLQIYRNSFDYTADIQLSSGGLIGGATGTLQITDDQKVEIKSADGSEKVQIYHTNSHTYFRPTKGDIYLLTDEGDNTSTIVDIRGKGTGSGLLRIRNQDNTNYMQFQIYSGYGKLEILGASPTRFELQRAGNVPIVLYSNSVEGVTQELQIYGRRTGDSARHLDIGISPDANDTALFSNVSYYQFDGQLKSTTAMILGLCQSGGFLTSPNQSIGTTEDVDMITFLGDPLGVSIAISVPLSLAENLNIANTKVFKVNSVQVVGARVIDARCDDALNSGDAVTDGVIDALRDAMITHGLIAAA